MGRSDPITSRCEVKNIPSPSLFPIVVLVSGRGSNLQAIIDAARRDLPVAIQAAISHRPRAYALERAARAGIPTHVIDHTLYPDREDFERALGACIDAYAPRLIVLAGFMRILSRRFVVRYEQRLINIHPSLLPALPGLHTHERALDLGLKEHGATVHFVTDMLDAGPIIHQARVPVLRGDTPETLAERVLAQEHRILPEVIRWFAEGRLTLQGEVVWLDGKPVSDTFQNSGDGRYGAG
jgi:phosphoribosylglycinamide formyltransferase-1